MMRLPENVLELLRAQIAPETGAASDPPAGGGCGVTILRLSRGAIGISATVQVCDVNGENIGLLCAEPMPVGGEFVLMAPRPDAPGIPVWCVVSGSEEGAFGDSRAVVRASFKQLHHAAVAAAPDAARVQAAILGS